MGVCNSNPTTKGTQEEQINNSKISKKMKNEQAKEPFIHRILLLGPGDSGKTTVLKQMRKIYGDSEQLFDNYGFIAIIKESLMANMKILCEQSIALNIAIEEKNTENRTYFMQELQAPYGSHFNTENCAKITELWADNGIRKTLTRRSEYQIPDNVEYFFDERFEYIAKDDYEVTFGDFLRIRMRTSGLMSEIFKKHISGAEHQFVFTDVGGQRSERTKWMTMMHDDVDAVLYVVAISEFDMVCFEDSSTLRLDEALSLFQTVVNNGFCSGKTVTLFFNKYDLFQQKLSDGNAKTISDVYDDFPSDKDPRNCDHVCRYIYNKFLKIYKEGLPDSDTSPYFHRTTALDTKQIDHLMKDIEADLTGGRLADIGF